MTTLAKAMLSCALHTLACERLQGLGACNSEPVELVCPSYRAGQVNHHNHDCG